MFIFILIIKKRNFVYFSCLVERIHGLLYESQLFYKEVNQVADRADRPASEIKIKDKDF